MNKIRLDFIDWMKALGMWTIVLGHFFPTQLQYLTYSFSVQLFFFVSGYLFKFTPDMKEFWIKNKRSLIYPYLILGGVNLGCKILRADSFDSVEKATLGFLLGIGNFDNSGGCGGLWFVITLFLMKVIVQILHTLRSACWFLLLSLPFMYLYRHCLIGSVVEWYGFSIGNILVAYPFFLGGFALSATCYDKISMISQNMETNRATATFVIGVVLLTALYFIAPYNGIVYMIYGGWGNSILLFYVYSICGILGVYLLSVGLSKCRFVSLARTLSLGSIVILAFQGYFIERMAPRLELMFGGKNFEYEIGSLCCSLLIMLVFIPIIKLIQRCCPIVLGKRKL